MLLENKGLMLLEVKVLRFRNNTPNEGMFNPKRIENNLK